MEAKGEPRPSSEEKGDADAEPSLAAKLTRFVEKNPLFKSAIRRFMEEHCARFTGDEGDEHKLEWTQLHDEFVQIVENALALFMRKTKGASEEELVEQLARSDEHQDLVEALAAKADYQRFCASMRAWRRQALQKQFDGMVGASERGVSTSSHK